MGYCAATAMSGAVVDDCPVTCGVCTPPSGGGFAANPFAEAATVLASSERTCGVDQMRTEIKTCDVTGQTATGGCRCTDGTDRPEQQETRTSEPCADDTRQTCSALGWVANPNGICYATNVLELGAWRAKKECKMLRRQKLTLADAVGHCESVGARLCTEAELASQPNDVHSASCKNDVKKRVWTSTPCGRTGNVIMVKASRRNKAWCTRPTRKSKGSQRCCADVVLPSADLYVIQGKSLQFVDGDDGDDDDDDDDDDGDDDDDDDDDDAVGDDDTFGSGRSGSGVLASTAAANATSDSLGSGDQGTSDPNYARTGDSGERQPLGTGSIAAIVVIGLCAAVGVLFVAWRSGTQAQLEAKLAVTERTLGEAPPPGVVIVTTSDGKGGGGEGGKSGVPGDSGDVMHVGRSGSWLLANIPGTRRTSNFAEAMSLNGESTDDMETQHTHARAVGNGLERRRMSKLSDGIQMANFAEVSTAPSMLYGGTCIAEDGVAQGPLATMATVRGKTLAAPRESVFTGYDRVPSVV
jgi:hypothetical protein